MAPSKDELLKMSEREFGRVFSRTMKLKKPVVRMKATGKNVDKVLQKLQEDVPIEEPKGNDMANGTTRNGNHQSRSRKSKDAKKKDGDAPRVLIIEESRAANPYREGSKKAEAFEAYKEGGPRDEVVAAIRKVGVTNSTASTWMGFFSQVVRTGKQRDWKEERSSAPKRAAKGRKSKSASASD